MNSVNLVGRFTRDPEMRMTQGGVDVANFTIAVDRAGDRNDEGGYDAGFFDCTAFGKTAELIGEWFFKGKQIGVTGRLQLHKWETQEGGKRSKVQIMVNDITFVGSRDDNGRENEHGQQYVPATSSTSAATAGGDDFGDDSGDFGGADSDIPFDRTIDGLGN